MTTHHDPLLEEDAARDPFAQFTRWFAQAAPAVHMPEAAALATASAAGRPSARMVLMKHWDLRGFVFHTNYGSRKAQDLRDNPLAALLFYWDPLGRQVRIEGPVETLGAAESDEYFATRPLGAQIGAHASEQSQPVESRELLDRRVRGAHRVLCRATRPASAVVGRVPTAARELRVLAEPGGPAARPPAVLACGGRLADRAAPTLSASPRFPGISPDGARNDTLFYGSSRRYSYPLIFWMKEFCDASFTTIVMSSS